MDRPRASAATGGPWLALGALGALVALGAFVAFVATGCGAPPRATPDQEANWLPAVLEARSPQESLARGRELFATHCAGCHGEQGRADGPAALELFPPARDFGTGAFRLVSTENAVPSDDDLVRTLRRGIPGSAMPAWSWLSEEDLWALAACVRELAALGLAERIASEAAERGPSVSSAQALAQAERRLRPGAHIVVGPHASPDAATLERGRALFAQRCAACHGADGRGSPTPRFAADGTLDWPRDFSAGWLKGDASHEDLAWRIHAGMPGSAMPATDLAQPELAALVAFVRSLIPEGVEDRRVQVRQRLIAQRITGPGIPGPGDARWALADALDVVLAPLWQRDASIHAAELAALHDGERLFVRLRWSDGTRNADPRSDLETPDGAALQLARGDAPALFGMGSAQGPTAIWHWRAVELAALDETLERAPPHAPRPSAPEWEIAPRARRAEPTGHATLYRAASLDSGATLLELGLDAAVLTAHDGEAWSVVFALPLGALEANEPRLAPGERMQLACALWNGAAGDRDAQKSISIWQELELAR